MSTTSPNMGLVLPTIGVDSGLFWEQSVNANSTLLDQHNHSPGYGVPINVSGINFNADLPLNNNNLTLARSLRMFPQASTLNGAEDLGCLYVSGVDLYYNDVDGNQVQITTGGTVNATSSGISSGTATASFVSSVLVVNAAANTPANIQGASLLLGNTGVAGSKYITLSPPSALATNYSLTLPAIVAPGSGAFIASDTSGNLSYIFADNVTLQQVSTIIRIRDQGVSTGKIADQAVDQSKKSIRPIGSTVAAGGLAIASAVGNITVTSATPTLVPNQTLILTTLGNPVAIGFTGGTFTGSSSSGTEPDVAVGIYRDSVLVGGSSFTYQGPTGAPILSLPASAFAGLDTVIAGVHTYELKVRVGALGGNTIIASGVQMFVYEL